MNVESITKIEKERNENKSEQTVENSNEKTVTSEINFDIIDVGEIDIGLTNEVVEEKNISEEFDIKIDNLKNDSSIDKIKDLYYELENSYKLKEIDNQYFKYATQYITDTYFSRMKGCQLTLRVIVEKIFNDIQKSGENEINIEDVNVLGIGVHIKNNRMVQDTLCMYGGNVVSIFGIYEDDETQYESYEKQTYIQPNIMEAIRKYIDSSEKANIEKYEGYYFVKNQENYRVQIYKEKEETSLTKTGENGIDKIKSKLCKLFGISMFSKKKFLANMEKLYDTDADLYEDILQNKKTKVNAKNRMKILLQAERKLV